MRMAFQLQQPTLPAFPAVCQHCGWTRQPGEKFEAALCRACYMWQWRYGWPRPLHDCPTCGRRGLLPVRTPVGEEVGA